jgi:hypothetical protein
LNFSKRANNLTLKLKATGGLLISGDIPQIIRDYINKDKFYEKFKISDKMEEMLRNIPIYLNRNQYGTKWCSALHRLLSRIKQTPKKFGVFLWMILFMKIMYLLMYINEIYQSS